MAEGLSRSTHGKGEHSKGTLVHDNVTEVAVVGNLYAHNVQRNPFFKGGSSGLVTGNVIYNAGSKAVHYALRADEWDGHPPQTGRLAVIRNVLKLGPDSAPDLALVLIEGEGPVELHEEGNLVLDRRGRTVEQPAVRDPLGLRKPSGTRFWPEDLAAEPTVVVFESVLRGAGARPWQRDAIDRRIVQEVWEGTGRIIDDEVQGGGYPRHALTQRVFDPGTLEKGDPGIASSPGGGAAARRGERSGRRTRENTRMQTIYPILR